MVPKSNVLLLICLMILNRNCTDFWYIWGSFWAPQRGDKVSKNELVTIMGNRGRQGSIFGAFLVDLGCLGEAFLRDFCCFLVWCGVAWRGAVWRGVAWRFYPSEASEASPVWLAFPSFVWLFLVSLVFPCFFVPALSAYLSLSLASLLCMLWCTFFRMACRVFQCSPLISLAFLCLPSFSLVLPCGVV